MIFLFGLFARSPEVEGHTGRLFADEQPVSIGGQAKQEGLAARLRNANARMASC
jgi:hypothetical protein